MDGIAVGSKGVADASVEGAVASCLGTEEVAPALISKFINIAVPAAAPNGVKQAAGALRRLRTFSRVGRDSFLSFR